MPRGHYKRATKPAPHATEEGSKRGPKRKQNVIKPPMTKRRADKMTRALYIQLVDFVRANWDSIEREQIGKQSVTAQASQALDFAFKHQHVTNVEKDLGLKWPKVVKASKEDALPPTTGLIERIENLEKSLITIVGIVKRQPMSRSEQFLVASIEDAYLGVNPTEGPLVEGGPALNSEPVHHKPAQLSFAGANGR